MRVCCILCASRRLRYAQRHVFWADLHVKTVWLLNHYAQAPSSGGGTRHYALAKYALHHDVKIIIVASSFGHLNGQQLLENGEEWRFETIGVVDFLWIRTSAYSGNGLARMRNMLEYTFRVLKPGITRRLPKPDLVVGSSVHPFAAVAGQRLARRHGVPFVFEVRDLWPETLIQMGRLERDSLMARVLRALEGWLYRRASKVITLLPEARRYIEGMAIGAEKIAWISNGVDLEEFPYEEPQRHNRLSVMYIGSHGQANALDRILLAAKKALGEGVDLDFRFVGDGPLKSDLQRQAEELSIADRVHFEQPVSKSRVPALAAEADIFIVNVRDLPLYKYGISLNKLFDYLAAGRPIVMASSAVNNPVADAGAGISVPGDDVEGMAEGLAQIASWSFEERVRVGACGRRHVEQYYSHEQLGRKLCDELLPLMK